MNELARPGKYYLGDPFDVLPSKIFNGIWGNVYNFRNGKFDINDADFIVHSTHYGDGSFKDTKNRIYEINTGVIALIDTLLIEDIESLKKGHVYTFKNRVNFIYDAGLFYIKSGKKYIQIDTRNLDEYNSDFEEHFENENGEYIQKTICGDSDSESIIDENEKLIDSEDEDSNQNSKEDTKDAKDATFSFFKKK